MLLHPPYNVRMLMQNNVELVPLLNTNIRRLSKKGPGVPKNLSLFEQFQNSNHCLVLNDVNGNIYLAEKVHLDDPYDFSRFFPHQNTSKICIFRKLYAGEVLEKVGNLAMEIFSLPSMLYITDVNADKSLSIS